MPSATNPGLVLDFTNLERTRAGLAPLTLNTRLFTAAWNHSSRMANGDFLSGTDPLNNSTALTRIQAAGYQYSAAGENIAGGQNSAQVAVTSWSNNIADYTNILNPNIT